MLHINIKLAARVMNALLSGVAIFHLAVLLGVIPYTYVWGGHLTDPSQMYLFEAIALAFTFAMIALISMRGGFIKSYLPNSVVSFSLWGLVVLFALSTLGNLFAQSTWETLLFTPIALISTLLCYKLAKHK